MKLQREWCCKAVETAPSVTLTVIAIAAIVAAVAIIAYLVHDAVRGTR
jgi:uncharacterized membrane protein